MRGPKVDLKLTIFLSCLRITVLGYPPLPEETPSIVTVVGIGGVRRRVRRGGSIRYGIGGLAGPWGKRTKVVIQDKPINKLEKFVAMSRRYRSHLIWWRRWLIGRFSFRTSSAARLPLLSSPAIGLIGSTKRGKKTATGFCEGGEAQRTEVVASIDVFKAGALSWYL